MKKLIFLGVAATALVAGSAIAQPQQGAGRTLERAQVESRVAAMFARVDADRDGFVTQQEAQGARTAMRAQRQERRGERREAAFARLDADRNGVISREEFTAPRARTVGGEAPGRAARMERRGGRGMRGPMRGRMGGGFGSGQAFTRMDADRDGRISLAEATRFRLERFDRVDANDDGRISREEIQAIRGERPAR
ncbi:MAG TPA: EF-hand domain-containing protein [Allosphingosinicella sp.]|jgi:hypothetical protein